MRPSLCFAACISFSLLLTPLAVLPYSGGRMCPPPLVPRYLKRLGLKQVDLDDGPTAAKLFTVTEAHLAKIPFENLAQHGAVGGPAVLDMDATAIKILNRRRGGFCFELNGLLAELLSEWGYGVRRVPALVCSATPTIPTHMFLIVTVPPPNHQSPSSLSSSDADQPDAEEYLVDVGFAEPALHPLRCAKLGVEQKTPEGMVSRLVRDGDDFVLEWLDHSTSSWEPRLRWSATSASVEGGGSSLGDFMEALDCVHDDRSIFSQKLVTCRLTRWEKITVSGDWLKRTGSPRFGANVPTSTTALGSVDKVREVLRDEFGIPLEETEGLDLTKSLEAPHSLWRT